MYEQTARVQATPLESLLTRFSASVKASNAAHGHEVQLKAALYGGEDVMVTVGTALAETTNTLKHSTVTCLRMMLDLLTTIGQPAIGQQCTNGMEVNT